jgi:hypothetical protein
MAEVAEHLPTTCTALSSNPSSTLKKKNVEVGSVNLGKKKCYVFR